MNRAGPVWHSGAHPGAADLNVERARVATACDVDTHVQAVAARDLVAEATAAGDHALHLFAFFEVIPGITRTDEAEDAPATVELPTQLGFELGDFLTLVTHRGHAAHADRRA